MHIFIQKKKLQKIWDNLKKATYEIRESKISIIGQPESGKRSDGFDEEGENAASAAAAAVAGTEAEVQNSEAETENSEAESEAEATEPAEEDWYAKKILECDFSVFKEGVPVYSVIIASVIGAIIMLVVAICSCKKAQKS